MHALHHWYGQCITHFRHCGILLRVGRRHCCSVPDTGFNAYFGSCTHLFGLHDGSKKTVRKHFASCHVDCPETRAGARGSVAQKQALGANDVEVPTGFEHDLIGLGTPASYFKPSRPWRNAFPILPKSLQGKQRKEVAFPRRVNYGCRSYPEQSLDANSGAFAPIGGGWWLQ